MKITVCEFPDEAPLKEAARTALMHFLRANPTDAVRSRWDGGSGETEVSG